MAKKKFETAQVGVRFPTDVLALVDKFVAEASIELMRAWPGVEMNRAVGIRLLVEEGLRVRGYLPSEKEVAAIIRAMDKKGAVPRGKGVDPDHAEYIMRRYRATKKNKTT